MRKRLIVVCSLFLGVCGCGEAAGDRILQPAIGVPASEKDAEVMQGNVQSIKEVPEDVKKEIMEYSQLPLSPHEAEEDSEEDLGILPQADESKDAGQEGNFTEISTIYCTVDNKNGCVKLKNAYDDVAVFTICDSSGTQISEAEEVGAGEEFNWTVPTDAVSGTYICRQVSDTNCRYVIIELKIREG